ncbi:Sperm-associated antigen 6 [Collichthys lucidus]|uniref:Sperm-associated antigen 6 n=1 Tax=Collichthys lucidus TaxID=240159 RepID=A0A4U5VI44_COLLU|nr:Sperm-associated antigen 6 [Collichthys lucidus]
MRGGGTQLPHATCFLRERGILRRRRSSARDAEHSASCLVARQHLTTPQPPSQNTTNLQTDSRKHCDQFNPSSGNTSLTMSQRQIIQVFEQYQKARMQFVQTVADLASRTQNIEILHNAGVMSMLRPLMLDVVPSIQQTAALALGRLADHSDDLAEAVVKEDILPQLVHSLSTQNVSISLSGQMSASLLQTGCPFL